MDGVDVDALGRYDDDTAKDDGEKRGVTGPPIGIDDRIDEFPEVARACFIGGPRSSFYRHHARLLHPMPARPCYHQRDAIVRGLAYRAPLLWVP